MQIEDALNIGRLRLRLISGCCLVALIVSFIFIYSAQKLAKDLGQETELRALKNEAISTLSYIEHIYTQHSPTTGWTMACNALEARGKDDPNLAFVFIDSNQSRSCRVNIEKTLGGHYSSFEDIVSKAEGFTTLDGHMFVWSSASSSSPPIVIHIVRRVISQEKAQEFVFKRLSIVSFITFWVAVWAAILVSVSVSKRIELSNKKLAHLATHDDLTGLFNRFYLAKKIRLFHKQNPNNATGAVLLIDLNGFKDVNDTLGHSAGDTLLCTIATRLKKVTGEQGAVARLGGDEFVIWLENKSKHDVLDIADALAQASIKPISVNGEIVAVSASIGCAYFPEHGTAPNTLLKNADEAMYRAKVSRQTLLIHSASGKHSSQYRLKLRSEIKDAIKNDEFVLYYQPKLRLSDGNIIGAEALVRWQHPKEGLLQPFSFIDLIEQSQNVHSFGFHILTKALMQMAEWKKMGIDISVAVNLSPYNMLNNTLPEIIESQLKLLKLSPSQLEIELTESATMVQLDVIADMFKRLRDIGVTVSIDDFGTGMSSFAYLKKLDVDIVKIDREFITDLESEDQNRLVVAGIISLCKRMRKDVVAEGVETVEQEHILKAMECDYVQGYYYAKPLPKADFLKFVEEHTQ